MMNSNKLIFLILLAISQKSCGRSYYGYGRNNYHYGSNIGSENPKRWFSHPESGSLTSNESPGDYDYENRSIQKSNKRRSMINQDTPSPGRFWNRPGFPNQEGNQGFNSPNIWNNPNWNGNRPNFQSQDFQSSPFWDNLGQQWNANRPQNNFPNWGLQYPDYYDTDTTTKRFPNSPLTNRPTTATQTDTQKDCIRTCPVTSEYNPVCGTNNVTYTNPSRLECAKYCGVDVDTHRTAACTSRLPTSTQSPDFHQPTFPTRPPWTSTSTRFPITQQNSDNGLTTKPQRPIPNDILQSIFTSSTTPPVLPSMTTEEDFDIDPRLKAKHAFPEN